MIHLYQVPGAGLWWARKFRFLIQKWPSQSFGPVLKQWVMGLLHRNQLGTVYKWEFPGLHPQRFWFSRPWLDLRNPNLKINKWTPLWMPPEDSVVQPCLGTTDVPNLLLNAEIPTVTWVTGGHPLSAWTHPGIRSSVAQLQSMAAAWATVLRGLLRLYLNPVEESAKLMSALGLGWGSIPTCIFHSRQEISTLINPIQ